MSAESEYIRSEVNNTLQTITLLEDLLAKRSPTKYEVIAMGKLLQDVYTGLERILRSLLEQQGMRIKKAESWHKELLLTAKERSLVSQAEFEAFRALLLFRHMEIHGYGFMLDKKRLRELGEPLPQLCRSFLEKVKELNAS
jgi:uncharacterized protein YutE (UPF0331/DUF86 family)